MMLNIFICACRQFVYLRWKNQSVSCSVVSDSVTPWVAHQAPLPMEFSRQEYWSGFPFPSPGDLPDPGIELGSPALQADSLPSKPPGSPESSPEQFESISSLVLSLPSSLSPFLIAQGALPHLTLGKSQWVTPTSFGAYPRSPSGRWGFLVRIVLRERKSKAGRAWTCVRTGIQLEGIIWKNKSRLHFGADQFNNCTTKVNCTDKPSKTR